MTDSLQIPGESTESEARPSEASSKSLSGNIAHEKFRKTKSFNRRNKKEGMALMKRIPEGAIKAAFFDPQYRGLLDKMGYGNEKTSKGKARANLPQMPDTTIQQYLKEIYRTLTPSGYLFMWMDKYILINNARDWLSEAKFEIVDLLVWHKQGHFGMGYRTRRVSEYLMVAQKRPKLARTTWHDRSIHDVFVAPVDKSHPHAKPVDLQQKLIEAVSKKNDIILDPCAGSFSVLEACKNCKRTFIGADING